MIEYVKVLFLLKKKVSTRLENFNFTLLLLPSPLQIG